MFANLCTQKPILSDLKGEIYTHSIIVGDFNTPLTSVDRSYRQKINKKTIALNDTLDHIDLDIYRAFLQKMTEYTFFSRAQGTFSRIDYKLGHKTSPNNFKKIEIIKHTF